MDTPINPPPPCPLLLIIITNSSLALPSNSSTNQVPFMAKSAPLPLPLPLSFLLLLLSFLSGRHLLAVNGEKTWCVARPSLDQATLLANINYACSQVDCRIMHKGCPCFYPDTLINHASVAMNLYYHSRGKNQWNCDFRGSALIVITDPSYGNCIYP